MNGFDIKPSIEPHDRYNNARIKLGEAVNAIKMLTPAEQEQLAYEFLNVRSKEEVIQLIIRQIQGN